MATATAILLSRASVRRTTNDESILCRIGACRAKSRASLSWAITDAGRPAPPRRTWAASRRADAHPDLHLLRDHQWRDILLPTESEQPDSADCHNRLPGIRFRACAAHRGN